MVNLCSSCPAPQDSSGQSDEDDSSDESFGNDSSLVDGRSSSSDGPVDSGDEGGGGAQPPGSPDPPGGGGTPPPPGSPGPPSPPLVPGPEPPPVVPPPPPPHVAPRPRFGGGGPPEGGGAGDLGIRKPFDHTLRLPVPGGVVTFYLSDKPRFVFECKGKGHGRCSTEKAAYPSDARGREGQGRPLGWGLAWLAECDSSTKEAHKLYNPSRSDRRVCRHLLRETVPEFRTLETECEAPKRHPDDDSEPETVPIR